MVPRRSSVAGFAMIAVVLGFSFAILAAADQADKAAPANSADSRVPLPVVPRGQGDSCVDDTDFMRRNHMDMLKHQRDETTLRGIRTEQYSLKECVACHAVAGEDAMPVTAASPKHFCSSCHNYAAVKIDCFQCHASRPEVTVLAADQGGAAVGDASE